MIYLILTMKALKRFVNDKFTKEIINKIFEQEFKEENKRSSHLEEQLSLT